VALGRAIVRDPAVFLFDEPLSNLDAKLRASMRTELIKLHKRLGTTFVYVTHDQTEAMTMGDRIVVMKDGFVQQVDTPQNLYDRPVNKFVAGFIGSPQMNYLTGTLAFGSGGNGSASGSGNASGDGGAGGSGSAGGDYFVEIGGDRILVPAYKVIESGAGDVLPAYVGKTVGVGIRPEDIHDEDAFLATNPEAVVSAKVDVAELMGSEVYLHLDYQGSLLTARVLPGTTSKIGDDIKIGINVDKIHLFDEESVAAIL
jgi:multiple sugar transport system ATP-binding protein